MWSEGLNNKLTQLNEGKLNSCNYSEAVYPV